MNAAESPGVRQKPKLVFFQWDHRPNADATKFLLLQMQQHVKCLATHFDVSVINEDCDYAAMCDRHEPDLALFESGYRSHGSRRIRVLNTAANPKVPKLGLHNADPWCDRRAGFLSDMEHWGIETFFSISTTMPAYTPVIADSLFVWPNFIDPEVFRDYGQQKTIPVMLTGQTYGLYPWRQKVFALIRDHYPCLVSPQFSYESRLVGQILAGESYARALNASSFAPACGTMGGEVVRKHFEIPGSLACLITERTPSVEAAGFVDMENCVFSDEKDVLDRIEYLFNRPHELRRITEAGHRLVHSRHTLRHRPQIHQWLMLSQGLQPHQKIVQLGPFGDLVAVDRSSATGSSCGTETGRDRILLRQADAYMARCRFDAAKTCYARCLDYVSYLPEAKFGLALCALHEGDAKRALQLLIELIEVTTVAYGAADPDPVEWAYFLVTLLCMGRVEQASQLRDFYPRLSHQELAHISRVIRGLHSRAEGRRPMSGAATARKSVHQLPTRSFPEWVEWLAGILNACGRFDISSRIRDLQTGAEAVAELTRVPGGRARKAVLTVRAGLRADLYRGVDATLRMLDLSAIRPPVPPMPEFRYFERLRWRILRLVIRGGIRTSLLRLRDRLRGFRDARRGRIARDRIDRILSRIGIGIVQIVGVISNADEVARTAKRSQAVRASMFSRWRVRPR